MVTEDIKIILAESLFKEFDIYRILEWAENCISEGYSSESLKKILETDKADGEKIKSLFYKSIEELKLEVPTSQEEILNGYIHENFRLFKQYKISSDYMFLCLLKVGKISRDKKKYQSFLEVQDDLENLYMNKKTLREGLNLENQEAYIQEEIRLFFVMEKLEIPISERFQDYCMICGHLTKAIIKNKYQIRRPFKYSALCCEHCGSEHLKSSAQHFVKRKIIESYL